MFLDAQTQVISRTGSYIWKSFIRSILTTSPFMTRLFLKNLSVLRTYPQPFLVQMPHNLLSVRWLDIFLAAKIIWKTTHTRKPARGLFLAMTSKLHFLSSWDLKLQGAESKPLSDIWNNTKLFWYVQQIMKQATGACHSLPEKSSLISHSKTQVKSLKKCHAEQISPG